MQTKKELRPVLRALRYALPKPDRAARSAVICRRVMEHAAFRAANGRKRIVTSVFKKQR